MSSLGSTGHRSVVGAPVFLRSLAVGIAPAAALEALAGVPGRVLLESVEPWEGRTLLGAAPRAVLRGRVGSAELRAVPGFPHSPVEAEKGSIEALDALLTADPRFLPTGGSASLASPPSAWIGALGYELASEIEVIEPRPDSPSAIPDLWFGAYDWLLSWPEGSGGPPVLSGMPFGGVDRAFEARLAAVEQLLALWGRGETGEESELVQLRARIDGGAREAIFAARREREAPEGGRASTPPGTPLPVATTGEGSGSRRSGGRAAGTPLPDRPHLRTTLSAEEHHEAVEAIRQYIRDGDLFQANLTTHLEVDLKERTSEAAESPHGGIVRGGGRPASPPQPSADAELGLALFTAIRARSPAPYAAFLELDGVPILSISPEGFLSVADGTIRTAPIKGTRPRGRDAEEDRALAEALCSSEKDRAENVMIVDLLRNDLSQLAKQNSVCVTRLLELESHPTVHHLVSEVEARIRGDIGWGAILRATFPGGSITGAPKVRAMEVLRELEPAPRGPYTGAIGWIGPGGQGAFSIAIRTATVEGGRARYGAGGGITLASDPEAEWDELLDKARAFIDAVDALRAHDGCTEQ